MQEIEARLEIGYKLQKKHQVKTTDELLQLQAKLEEELQEVYQADERIVVKEKEAAAVFTQLQKEAIAISQKRNKQCKPLEKNINELLQRVGMPNARMKIEVETIPLNPFGCDEIRFLFDANKSNRFELLQKVASGGELSRLMLCIKSLVAASMELPTMIFDEIDTGISGEAARQVGLLLQELSLKHQVLTITHLPQIAAKATAHFYVYKEEKAGGIQTKIKLLSEEEQIETIARMLSGELLTESSLRTARELVNR
jgi:DNA repair protein RecN (Recombination protein N)